MTQLDAYRLRVGDADVRRIIATTIEDGEVIHLVSGKIDTTTRRQAFRDIVSRG